MIVLGVLFVAGGCCTCGVIANAAASENDEVVQPVPAPSVVPVEPDAEVGEPDGEEAVEEETTPPPPPRRPRPKPN